MGNGAAVNGAAVNGAAVNGAAVNGAVVSNAMVDDYVDLFKDYDKCKPYKFGRVYTSRGFNKLMYLLGTFPDRTELLIKYIINHPEQINEQNEEGWIPLMIVAQNSRNYDLRILKLLIENGAKSSIKNSNGHTALILAIMGNNNLAVIDVLLKVEEYHSKILIKISHFYITNRLVILVLRHGINPNNQIDRGVTALMMLSGIIDSNHRLSMAKILLIHGANQYIKTGKATALDILGFKANDGRRASKLYQTHHPEL
jgi:ankyrin repeat protein